MNQSHLMPAFSRLPVAFVRGEGVWLWDAQGKRYLDALAGVAVCGLGHAHPRVAQAICAQASTLLHTSNIYQMPLQEQLAKRLCALSGLDAVFFGNSGAEANEAAIKLARLYGNEVRQVSSPKMIVFSGSFHGRTLATLSASGNPKIQKGFEPLVSGFIHVPFNDLAAVQALRDDPDIVAVMVEPVQGEGGVNLASAAFLQGLREICTAQGWLMILDEIQTGMGRTGKWFAHQHFDVLPDVMTLAKGLGNGFPIGAILAKQSFAQLFGPGRHGSTFSGGHLACTVGLTVIEVIEQDKLCQHAAEMGAYLCTTLTQALAHLSFVREIRGHGLMIGIALDRPALELPRRALDRGILINVTAESVIRLLPPLILQQTQADLLVATLVTLLEDGL